MQDECRCVCWGSCDRRRLLLVLMDCVGLSFFSFCLFFLNVSLSVYFESLFSFRSLSSSVFMSSFVSFSLCHSISLSFNFSLFLLPVSHEQCCLSSFCAHSSPPLFLLLSFAFSFSHFALIRKSFVLFSACFIRELSEARASGGA